MAGGSAGGSDTASPTRPSRIQLREEVVAQQSGRFGGFSTSMVGRSNVQDVRAALAEVAQTPSRQTGGDEPSAPHDGGLFERLPFTHSFNKSLQTASGPLASVDSPCTFTHASSASSTLSPPARSRAQSPQTSVTSLDAAAWPEKPSSAAPAAPKGPWWSLGDLRPPDGEARLQKSNEIAASSIEFSLDLPKSVVPARAVAARRGSLELAPDTALAHARQRADEAMLLRAKHLGLPNPARKLDPTAFDIDVEALISSFAMVA